MLSCESSLEPTCGFCKHGLTALQHCWNSCKLLVLLSPLMQPLTELGQSLCFCFDKFLICAFHPRTDLVTANLQNMFALVHDRSVETHMLFQGIQLVKQLRRTDSALKQDAEIALYLKQFDEAETLYRRMDRPDLAVDMHMRLGNWIAVSFQCRCWCH